MPTRVVSKRTKLLFIGFGAAAIASVCIVYFPSSESKAGTRPAKDAVTATALPAK